MTVKELRELLYNCRDENEVIIDGDGEIASIVEHKGITDETDNRVVIWSK